MLKGWFLKAIRFYQKSRIFHLPIFRSLYITDSVCRFQPSCSEYSYQAIAKYGIIKGILLGVGRIFKCHPWNKGDYDPLI